MTTFEKLKSLDSVEKVANYICQHINVLDRDSRLKEALGKEPKYMPCDFCPFESMCTRGHNGVLAWLNSTEGSDIKWTVE